MKGEISYDLVMCDDMVFVEGTYRLGDGKWHVFIVSRYEIDEPQVVPQVWPSGVAVTAIHFPRSGRLNQQAVEVLLANALSLTEWVQVRGPDSMQLR